MRYFIVQRHESTWGPRDADAGPARKQYLAKFADTEGRKYLSRFYGKYKGKSSDEALKTLVDGIVPAPVRLAVIYRSIMPQNGLKEFSSFVKKNLPRSELSEKTPIRLYSKYAAGSFSLVDRGFLARVHPLELWTVAYLHGHPAATQAIVLPQALRRRGNTAKNSAAIKKLLCAARFNFTGLCQTTKLFLCYFPAYTKAGAQTFEPLLSHYR
jgi:hypothetical protein